jgi:hypothetical protein
MPAIKRRHTPGPLREDLSGRDFGFLHVLELVQIEGGHGYWKCECRRPAENGKLCGIRVVVRDSKLKSGRQVSCSCARGDPEVRRTARLQVPARERKRIAKLGAKARWKLNNPRVVS